MNISPIGTIHSCFKEKFCIPRQSGLIQAASATLELLPPYNVEEALRGIEEFTHLWIIFAFHKSVTTQFKPTVRPPRLGGNKRVGVFATRSPFRPNPIGLSVVELTGVSGTTLSLAGVDFLDQTPVLDIKPYIPYADSIPHAHGAFAAEAPASLNQVHFSASAAAEFERLPRDQQQLLRDALSFNPRPAYQADDPNRIFGTRFFDFDVTWKHINHTITVETLTR